MFEHVNNKESACVQVGSNTYQEPVTKYARIPHDVVDLRECPWYVRLGSAVCPQQKVCTEVEGMIYTHIRSKK
jgi:hypothetical protein